jgi:hypothetical protein
MVRRVRGSCVDIVCSVFGGARILYASIPTAIKLERTANRRNGTRASDAVVSAHRAARLRAVLDMTTEPTDSDTKENRFVRDARLALHLGRQPADILPLLRRWLAKLWASRGGGFYGLGYVVTFVALEIRSLSSDLTTTSGLVAQAAQYLLRFSIDSLRNVISALIWPAHLFEWLGGPAGLVALVVGYAAFELAIRPVVQARLPEVGEALAERQRLKQEKREKKRARRARSPF